MTDIVIRVENLSKLYRIGKQERYTALRDKLAAGISAPFRWFTRRAGADEGEQRTIWALSGVSFELKRGEVAGVIGRNGAGKTTLLKILSRITEPTVGSARIRGRVGSLLEVGSGFHPELTGRENVYMNAAILGMKRAEIARKFDEMVEFAEVGNFIDTPVKHYSSGMQMRLAFSVAAHLEPEILIVDEVLAVGDAAFQKKCLGKIGQVSKQGRTVLFVSHNLTAVSTLCTIAMRLDRGKLIATGAPAKMVSAYLLHEDGIASFDPASYPDDQDFKLNRAELSQKGSEGVYNTSVPIELLLQYEIKKPLSGLRIGFDLTTVDGIVVWRSFDDDLQPAEGGVRQPGTYLARCIIPKNTLGPRSYLISLSIGIHNIQWISVGKIQQKFDLFNSGGVGSSYADESWRPGVVLPGLEWQTSELVGCGGRVNGLADAVSHA